MEKIFVADSYANGEILGEPYQNLKGKMVVRVRMKCPRCCGSGNFLYNQVDGAMCYGCRGAGYVIDEVRAYTEKEYNAMKRANERAKERKLEAKAAKEKDLIDNAAKYKHEIALKKGFNEDEKIFIVYGGDTYSIKNSLKEQGARFDPVLKWYVSTPIDLPEGYKLCEVSFDEIYDYTAITKWATFKSDVEKILSEKMIPEEVPNTDFYPAAVKDRVKFGMVKLTAVRGFEGAYGYTHIYTFSLDNYVFVWMTTKTLDLSVNDCVSLTGTIKDFNKYEGINQTILNRCVVEKVEE